MSLIPGGFRRVAVSPCVPVPVTGLEVQAAEEEHWRRTHRPPCASALHPFVHGPQEPEIYSGVPSEATLYSIISISEPCTRLGPMRLPPPHRDALKGHRARKRGFQERLRRRLPAVGTAVGERCLAATPPQEGHEGWVGLGVCPPPVLTDPAAPSPGGTVADLSGRLRPPRVGLRATRPPQTLGDPGARSRAHAHARAPPPTPPPKAVLSF